MDVEEAAAHLSIAPKTLYKWVEQGFVPVIKIGRLVRFRRCDLEEWLRLRLMQPPTTFPKRSVREVK